MKTKILLIIFILFNVNIALGNNWQWAKQIGGIGEDLGSVRLDLNGNLYCSGQFESNCYYDTDTVSSSGSNDMFLVKYDPAGNTVWIKTFGGNNPSSHSEGVDVVSIDNANNCLYYSGYFYEYLTIDNHSVTSSSSLDLFLAKFDLDGNCLWIKTASSALDDINSSLAIDGNGNVFWAGELESSGSFESNTLSKGTFLSKIDVNGALIWVKNEITGGHPNHMKFINNNLLIAGRVEDDTTVIDTASLIASHLGGIFIAKVDMDGNFISGKKYESNLTSWISSFDIDNNNNIYVGGIFDDSLFLTEDTLYNGGVTDFFLMKLDSNFEIIWSKQSNVTGGAGVGSIILDNFGNIYICGYFSGSANLGSYHVTSSVSSDMLIARYDPNGDCIGVNHFGEARSGSVNIDSNGDLIISGTFINTVNIGNTTLTSYGSSDMFFAKSDPIIGIVEVEKTRNNLLEIYANPSLGKCNIVIPDEFKNEKNLLLKIYDYAGKVIQQQNVILAAEKISLNLEEEASGVYNVTLSNGKVRYNGRIVFQ